MEVTYTDECKEALGDSARWKYEEIKNFALFCAKGLREKVGGTRLGPCNVSITN